MFNKKVKTAVIALAAIVFGMQVQAQKPQATPAPAKTVKSATPVKAAPAAAAKMTDKKQEAVKAEKKAEKKVEKKVEKAEIKATGEAASEKKIITGAKGGKYYINKNGKKTYVK